MGTKGGWKDKGGPKAHCPHLWKRNGPTESRPGGPVARHRCVHCGEQSIQWLPERREGKGRRRSGRSRHAPALIGGGMGG